MEETKNYTHELKETLIYMNDILINEFPSNLLTQEYLIASILDNRRCHANLILNNCLMSSNIDELRNIFLSYLKDHSNPLISKTLSIPKYDKVLERIINNAEIEKNSLNSKSTGTEHILLSLLNPKNENEKMINIFRNIGIDYSFILSKCDEKDKFTEKIKNALNKQKRMQNILPLKSEINPTSQLLVSKTKNIEKYTIDINKMANEGKIDSIVGREKEMSQIVKVLARRKKNNAVLVGKSGCGKTALVLGLAKLIEEGNVPNVIKDKKIVQLNIAALIAGTYLRGAFEERIKGLFDEMKSSNKYILFIDDIHTVLKSSSKERDTDISSMINDILAEGDIKVIGTTSFKDYRNSIENNTMICRRLQKIVIEPTTKKETIEILHNNKKYYEKHHNVYYTDDAINSCVELAERYITDRTLPDSAIDVIDFCGASTCFSIKKPEEIIRIENELENLNDLKSNLMDNGDFEGVDSLLKDENKLKIELNELEREYNKNLDKYRYTIEPQDICKAISEITNIPVNKLGFDEKKKLSTITETLKGSVIGQDDAIEKICKSIKRNKVGLGNSNKVIFSGLLAGPTGVGKTLLAKKLAEYMYGDEKALIRFDMSEYSEKSSVSKLIGASAGYIGHENGGVLTEAVKNKPYSVVVFDEIEKANEEIYNLFLQMLDEGTITDNVGNHINFKNVIVLMTSNVGATAADEFANGVGFIENKEERNKSILDKELKKTFKPEFLNRLDKIIYFNHLTDENYSSIIDIELNKTTNKLKSIGFNLKYNNDVIEFILSKCRKERKFGARPILRFIQDNVLDSITDLILNDEYENGHVFNISVNDDKLVVI